MDYDQDTYQNDKYKRDMAWKRLMWNVIGKHYETKNDEEEILEDIDDSDELLIDETIPLHNTEDDGHKKQN